MFWGFFSSKLLSVSLCPSASHGSALWGQTVISFVVLSVCVFFFCQCEHVYSGMHMCGQGQSKWRCIISNYSEHGHRGSLARQSYHLRGCFVWVRSVASSFLSLLVSLSVILALSFNAPSSKRTRKTPTAMTIRPYLLPLAAPFFFFFSSSTPAHCPLPPWGRERQGHRDKHRNEPSH